jgi:hypothetical protein
MQYEALYAAVISAAPTVLIGFVLEVRLSMRTNLWKEYPRHLRFAMSCIAISNGLSALFSVYALAFGGWADSPKYAGLVAVLFVLGLSGLTAVLYYSFDNVNSGRQRGLEAP